MLQMKRVILIILDGLGIGESPDADLLGDTGDRT
jgi:phosphopentomutase